ncbi:cpras2, partial [Symbiodinium sp. KB8]
DFGPLVAFCPGLVTDATGRVTVPVKLSDSLTSIRFMATAVAPPAPDGDGLSSLLRHGVSGKVGSTTVETALPLEVRPAFPRFLSYGDVFDMPVVVSNNTSDSLAVKAVLAADGVLLGSAGPAEGDEGYTPDKAHGAAGVSTIVPPKSQARMTVAARVVRAAGGSIAIRGVHRLPPADVRVLVEGVPVGKDLQPLPDREAIRDCQLSTLPVRLPTAVSSFASYCELAGDGTALAVPLHLPQSVLLNDGGLVVEASSSILQCIGDAVADLADYPYDCVEQRSSRILALAAISPAADAFKPETWPSRDAIASRVEEDLQMLWACQQSDGGFTFWGRLSTTSSGFGGSSRSRSLPITSMSAALACAVALQHGFQVPAQLTSGLSKYLRNASLRMLAQALYCTSLFLLQELKAEAGAGDQEPAAGPPSRPKSTVALELLQCRRLALGTLRYLSAQAGGGAAAADLNLSRMDSETLSLFMLVLFTDDGTVGVEQAVAEDMDAAARAAAEAEAAARAAGAVAYPASDAGAEGEAATSTPAPKTHVEELKEHLAACAEVMPVLAAALANHAGHTASQTFYGNKVPDGTGALLDHPARSCALALLAQLKTRCTSDDAITRSVKGLLGLLAHRTRAGSWSTTHANGWAVFALAEYFAVFESQPPQAKARVWVGPRLVAAEEFSGHSLDSKVTRVSTGFLSNLLQEGDAQTAAATASGEAPAREFRVVLAKDALNPETPSPTPSRLFFRVALRTVSSELQRSALDRGFRVQRQYTVQRLRGGASGSVPVEAEGVDVAVRAGLKVQVGLLIENSEARQHVAIVDHLPAGLEPLRDDLSAGVSFGGGSFGVGRVSQLSPDAQSKWPDRVGMFCTNLPAGRHEMTYVALASTPGRFTAPPARAEEMYCAETFGSSPSAVVVVG